MEALTIVKKRRTRSLFDFTETTETTPDPLNELMERVRYLEERIFELELKNTKLVEGPKP